MSDVDGGAAAPADGSAAASNEIIDLPNPISTEREPKPDPSKDEPSKPVSTREALRRAAEKVERDNATDKPGAVKSDAKAGDKPAAASDKPAAGSDKKPDADKDKPARGEHGHFAPKAGDKPAEKPAGGDKPAQATPAAPAAAAKPGEAKAVSDAPARFADDAKAIWKDTPEPVRRETERAISELTKGIEKYKAGHESNEQLREFHEMAQKHGTTVKDALTRYTNMESLLRQDLVKGITAICDNVGVSLRDVAAHIMGQTPDQRQSEDATTIRELRQQVQHLTQQVGGITKGLDQQRQDGVLDQVSQWAADKPHFELIAPHIAAELQSGANSLDDAYQAVLQKYPQLAALATAGKEPDLDPAPASSAAAPDLSAQTEKGSKSIQGAPSAGSSPANSKPSTSIKESLRRAFAQAG